MLGLAEKKKLIGENEKLILIISDLKRENTQLQNQLRIRDQENKELSTVCFVRNLFLK